MELRQTLRRAECNLRGDMGQLRPVISSALYAYNLVNRPTVHTRETLSGQAGMFSAAIWRQLMHVVELKENMRAKEDPQFVALLA
jgi:hypothetical protein